MGWEYQSMERQSGDHCECRPKTLIITDLMSQCFVLSGVLAIVFIAWELYLGERAMTPMAILHSGSMYEFLSYLNYTDGV